MDKSGRDYEIRIHEIFKFIVFVSVSMTFLSAPRCFARHCCQQRENRDDHRSVDHSIISLAPPSIFLPIFLLFSFLFFFFSALVPVFRHAPRAFTSNAVSFGSLPRCAWIQHGFLSTVNPRIAVSSSSVLRFLDGRESIVESVMTRSVRWSNVVGNRVSFRVKGLERRARSIPRDSRKFTRGFSF